MEKKKKNIITKSRYLNGLKCLKLLWIDCNERERIPPPDISQQHIFDQGDMVGVLAKKLYPEGIDVPYDRGKFFDNIERTKELLSSRKTLFAAGILYGDVYSRVDIFQPSDGKKWNIIEVKSSTDMKDVYLDDVAFQKYCCEKMGLQIDKCFLMQVDNSYVKDGDIDLVGFFQKHDITDEIDAYVVGIEERIERIRKTIAYKQCPEIEIGIYCSKPYGCFLTGECWGKLSKDNIFTLYNYGPKKGFPLYKDGIETIKDLPEEGLGVKQLIQKRATETGETYIDRDLIRTFLEKIQYPICYMDFETINPAIPLFDGMRPYRRIPFQFSVHVKKNKEAELEHYSFLHRDKEDPRENFLKELKGIVGNEGTIMVYNRTFEESVLRELAASFPEYDSWVKNVQNRIVDLLEPFKGFYYYNPEQCGSASFKKVLPAVTGKGYEGMDIAGGSDASALYFKATYLDKTEAEEKEKIYSDLEKYCSLDTEGMDWVVTELIGCSKPLSK